MVSTTETPTELRIRALQGLYDAVGWLAWPAVRFVAGAFLVPHGAQKLFGLWGGNIQNTGASFAKMGLEPGLPLAYLVGSWEFFGGILIAIGFLTRPAALGAAFLLAVATFMVHLPLGFFWSGSVPSEGNLGSERKITYAVCSGATTGSGKYCASQRSPKLKVKLGRTCHLS